MNGISDASGVSSGSGQGLASWYLQGHTDGFGDRLLMFDNAGTPSLELLRFRADLSSSREFEEALRARVRELSSFAHPAFAVARTVERLDEDGRLVLVSEHAPGRRLSELLGARARSTTDPALVSWLLREATAALAALHAHGSGTIHAALTPERLVITAEGRLLIVEHVLGSALQRLRLPASRLWRELRLISLPSYAQVARLDARTDVIQLAGIALSMLLARPVTLDDLQRAPALLDELGRGALGAGYHGGPLRHWLSRALQIADHPYASPLDARADLNALPAGDRQSSVAVRMFDASDVRSEPVAEAPRPDAFRTQRPEVRGTTYAHAALTRHEIDELFPIEEERRPRIRTRSSERAAARAEAPQRGESESAKSGPGVDANLRRSVRFDFEPVHGPGVEPVGAPAWQGLQPEVRTERPWLVLGLTAVAVAQSVLLALYVSGVLGARQASVVIETATPGETLLLNGEPIATPYHLEVGEGVTAIRLGTPGVTAGKPAPGR